MTQYVAFLRAVNVAGHGRLKMSDVRDAFVVAGGRNVETVIQSGNVLFESLQRDVSRVAKNAKGVLTNLLGEEPGIMVRPFRRLIHLMDHKPFGAISEESKAKLYIVFLSRRPRLNVVFPLVSRAEDLEAIGINEYEVFVISHPKKSGFYGFPNNFIEEALGVKATSRNWATIARLVKRGAQ